MRGRCQLGQFLHFEFGLYDRVCRRRNERAAMLERVGLPERLPGGLQLGCELYDELRLSGHGRSVPHQHLLERWNLHFQYWFALLRECGTSSCHVGGTDAGRARNLLRWEQGRRSVRPGVYRRGWKL